MPWTCPSCQSQVEHRRAEDLPVPDKTYRCPRCRLNLIFDPDIMKMRPAPKIDDTPKPKRRRTA